MKTLIKPAVFLLTVVIGSGIVSGQGVAMADSSMLDFWIGSWDLTWEDPDGTNGQGMNEIYKYLDDRVIFENFEGMSGVYKGFKGKSWSVYNRRTGEWKQTWVDNQGAYLDFDGMVDEGKVIFQRRILTGNGSELIQRMVFHDIRKDKFIWDWEVSGDGGQTWKLNWRIHYRRKGQE